NPVNVGLGAFTSSASSGFNQCTHGVSTPFNQRIGFTSHLGIATSYSNPGVILVPVGLKVYPLKGHEIVGFFIYRAMANTNILEIAFAPELAARPQRGGGIAKTEYYDIGGSYQWTLNPNFDIRLSGSVAVAGEGFRDLAHLATCTPGGTGAYATSTQ